MPHLMYTHTSPAGAIMPEDLLREDVTATIDHIVDELLDRAQLAQPPVDVLALAQNTLGMLVCLVRRRRHAGRAKRTGGRPVISFRPKGAEDRLKCTAANVSGVPYKV